MLIQNVPISMTELFELIGSKDDQILQPSDIYSGSLTGKVNRILRWIGNPYETWQETDDYSLTKINRGMIELIGIPPLGDTIIDGTNVPHIESLHGKIRQLEEKIDNLDISPPAIQTTSPIKSIQRGVIGGDDNRLY